MEHTCNTSFDSSKDFMLIFQFSAVSHKISVIGGKTSMSSPVASGSRRLLVISGERNFLRLTHENEVL